MHRHPVARTAAFPQGRLLWVLVASLIAAQLAAFWMLCSLQVRTAQVRPAALQMQRTVQADCLLYIRDASRDSCEKPHQARLAAMNGASPMQVSLR